MLHEFHSFEFTFCELLLNGYKTSAVLKLYEVPSLVLNDACFHTITVYSDFCQAPKQTKSTMNVK